ncbi:MAG: PAS domain S-box protein [Methanosarcinaceae archaeon]|nr:PAS domain S-box protein [Methanosarcinaceae archaeon]
MYKNEDNRSKDELLLEIERLRAQLTEAEKTLNAIRSCGVDAQVFLDDKGEQVFTLKDAECPYRVFIEEMRDGAVSLSSVGNILYCNRSFSRIVKVPTENLIGTNILQIISPDSISLFETLLTKETTVPSKREIDLLAGDGTIIPSYLSINSIKVVNEWKIYIVVTDLTNIKEKEKALLKAHDELEVRVHERTFELSKSNDALKTEIFECKQAEEKVRNAHKQLSDIIEFLPDATFAIDAEKKVIVWNRATEEMTGIKKEDILGKGDYAYSTPFYGKRRPILINLTSGSDCEIEEQYDFLENEGRLIYAEKFVPYLYGGKGGYIRGRTSPLFDGDGKWAGSLESIRDITERKNMEEALRTSEEKYRNIVETAQEGIWVLDKKGKTIYVNKRMAEMVGYPVKDMLGSHIFGFMDDETRSLVKSKMGHWKQGFSYKHEIRFLRGDGSYIWTLLSTKTILDASGHYNGILGMITDISDLKKMEEIRLENESLIYANNIKSEFMAVMSHELKTPLSSIIGYSQLMKENIHGELNEKQEYYVNNILEGSKHLLDLINSILDMVRIEAGKMLLVIEEVSVPVTIEAILHFIEEQAKVHNVVLKKEMDPEVDIIEVDKQKFKQIMLNLLNNAIKFSKDGGGIVIIRTKRDGDMARISVSDTGIGIKKIDLKRLFLKFEQLDSSSARKYEGTGLGLSITKQLVEMHGGTIMVESKYGEGSTFTFSLPIKAEK